MDDLFAHDRTAFMPLAARMRPASLEDYVGQEHIFSPGKPLYQAVLSGKIHSLILWGPPGTGKTSFAKLISQYASAEFITLSAVLSGVQDIKACIQTAQSNQRLHGRQTVLFIDEIHRFNKSQQDLFLPFIEDGTIIFIGATTENPSFEVNNAILSRVRVYHLRSLGKQSLSILLKKAISGDIELSSDSLTLTEEAESLLIESANGDARRLLNYLEASINFLKENHPGVNMITEMVVKSCLGDIYKRFDKGGEVFYELISALHKSVRGSDPDASLYWAVRMLEGGCDPFYLARRLIRIASEDIGNADPKALQVVNNAWESYEKLGSPEGELALAQAVIYLAVAPKSNAVYNAYNSARQLVNNSEDYSVPLHLRNAPTALMKDEGYGDGYRYAHDEENGFAAGENYFPQDLKDLNFYHPVERGLEIKIGQKLERLRALNKTSSVKRY